jgi:hypothetical protein
MTDNFENYRKFIELNGGLPDNNEKGNLDKYYVIELMRRGKDNPDLPAANYHFKNYYIYSWKDLTKYEEEIKNICTLLRLRAYASVNYKLMSQVALDTMAESARRIAAHDFKKFYNIFESCSGKFVDKGNNLWIIDIDSKISKLDFEKLHHFINKMESKYEEKLIYTMPTKNGLHLICHPFNKKQFMDDFRAYMSDSFSEIPDIKMNHLTLLYENL